MKLCVYTPTLSVRRFPALPADSYEQTKVLAPLFNTLVDRISRDGPWLKEVLKDVLVRVSHECVSVCVYCIAIFSSLVQTSSAQVYRV